MPIPPPESSLCDLHRIVSFLKRQELVTISFPVSLLPTYIGAEVTLQREHLAHLDTAPGFLWWHAGHYGYQAVSWQHAARRYSARHGMAIVVNHLQATTVIVNAFGLNFLRNGGTITQPPVVESAFRALPDPAAATNRWHLAFQPAASGGWLHLCTTAAPAVDTEVPCMGRIVHRDVAPAPEALADEAVTPTVQCEADGVEPTSQRYRSFARHFCARVISARSAGGA
jgi:hypothetical protein